MGMVLLNDELLAVGEFITVVACTLYTIKDFPICPTQTALL